MHVSEVIAAILSLLQSSLPSSLQWIAQMFAQLLSKQANGAGVITAAAPDELKSKLATMIEAMISKISNPFIRTLAQQVGAYVVTYLVDGLWNQLFAPKSATPVPVMMASIPMEASPEVVHLAAKLEDIVTENSF